MSRDLSLSPASFQVEARGPSRLQARDIELDMSQSQCPTLPTVKIRRLWEFWPGNNQFYLSGLVMLGPRSDRWHVSFTWLLFLGVTICYFVNVVPYLWIEVTPALPLLTTVLLFNCLVFMLLTMLVDPGIIPRKCVFELNKVVPEQFTSSALQHNSKLKHCPTCEIYRPERAHHCSVCDNCVEQFDHHCPFLNNCMGKRNYCYFLMLIGNSALYGISMVAGLILFQLYDNQRDKTDHTVMDNSATVIAVTIVLSVLIAALTLLVTVLCLFHMTLCYSGETTKERLKGSDGKTGKRSFWRTSLTWFDRRQILTLEQLLQIKAWKQPRT